MKTVFKSIALASLVALAACGGKGDDALADNVEANADNVADALDAQADNAVNEATEDMLENQADSVRENGEAAADAIDDADVNAQQLKTS
jgi:predicted small lipoprotein YifL